ncbi:hypothetical protein HID58_051657 [Brassica napus]|uniref:Uncharacterized protein n=1 Tax=Brassica napus TaxID=3708 RepID=A0ABQ8AA01_BRANA|nr:hypothetical protein HID58_051657 [Brassica napus]
MMPPRKSKEIEIAMDAISVVKLCFVCDLSVNQEQMMYVSLKLGLIFWTSFVERFHLSEYMEETLALDARFGDSKLNLVSPSLSPLIPSPSRVKGGGCGRVKFGIKSAAVRVEGFDCLDRDRQNSSIPAMA